MDLPQLLISHEKPEGVGVERERGVRNEDPVEKEVCLQHEGNVKHPQKNYSQFFHFGTIEGISVHFCDSILCQPSIKNKFIF